MNVRYCSLRSFLILALLAATAGETSGQWQYTSITQLTIQIEHSAGLIADTALVPNPAKKSPELPGTYAPQKKRKQIAHYPGPLYVRNEHSNFWKKAGRAQIFIGGVEVVGMIALVAMPKEVTKWEDDWVQSISRNWKRTFTQPPVKDQDDFWLNYIAHPVVGSWYYNSVRSQHAKWWESFLWSLAQSTFWEYVIEGMAEQPSIQDLWITPVIGSALGEPIHLATLAMRKNGYTFLEKVAVTILNPMFVVNNGYRTPLTYQKRNLARF